MEIKCLFNPFPEDKFTFKMGGRGAGKLAEIQRNLPILMTRNTFKVGRYKDTTVIKLDKFDDLYIFFRADLKYLALTGLGWRSESVLMRSLYTVAKEYQKLFESSGNRL